MPTTAIITEVAITNVVGKGSEPDCVIGVGETVGVGVGEGKGNSDGSKKVEIGLVSGDWSVPLTASAATFTIAS